jgi:hypothetical protein
MTGTLLFKSSNGSETTQIHGVEPAWECTASLNQGSIKINCDKGVGALFNGIAIHQTLGGINCSLGTPQMAIVKSYSVNTSQGSAATFSLSGTIYDFPLAVGC